MENNELVEEAKRKGEVLMQENRKLERMRAELVTAVKKQFKLISLLKKQKTHIESSAALGFSEEEYIKALDLTDKLA